MQLVVDGCRVDCDPGDDSLLTVLRDQLAVISVKDGCSPQGQCGCCTVLIDGSPRVSCVTPARRVAGRSVTTVDGLDPELRHRLVEAFVAKGASQCGFCTPGILVRLCALGAEPHPNRVENALLAHLCRCTGWNSIVDAALAVDRAGPDQPRGDVRSRDLEAASARASLEGRVPQVVGPDVVLGRGGFAADTFPAAVAAENSNAALTAVPDGVGGWAVGDSLPAARARVVRVPGRRSGRDVRHPVAVPEGEWALTLQTTWVEPAYLEPDVSWCLPGGSPASPVANGGAFGGKTESPAPSAASELAGRLGRPVRVVLSREEVVRMGPKRPPIGAGLRPDGTGILRIVRTPGVVAAVASVAPGLVVEEVDVVGPPTGASIRGAGWVEAAVLLAGLRGRLAVGPPGSGTAQVTAPWGAWASATVVVDGSGAPSGVAVRVRCGRALDETVLRSYVVGAAHMALGWVCSEAIAVDDQGVPVDLTIRSFGVLRARDMATVEVEIEPSTDEPVNGSDPAFAAVAAAAWMAQGTVSTWPTRRGSYR